jgi:uncharacterized membrane protein HdeD (DUF308 family)
MESTANAGGPFASLQFNWGWFLAIGIALVILGTIAMGDTLVTTMISVVLVGWLLVAAGIFHVINMIRHTEVRSFWHILGAICDFLAGFYLLARPALGALTLTLILAAFLLASGVTRLIGVFQADLPHKFWPVLDALLSIVLGVLLWIHWPWTGLWFIGFAVGIGLIFRGWGWIWVAFALRRGGAQPLASPVPA